MKSERAARTNGSDPTEASSRPKYSQPDNLKDSSEARKNYRIMSAGKNEARILLSSYRNRVND